MEIKEKIKSLVAKWGSLTEDDFPRSAKAFNRVLVHISKEAFNLGTQSIQESHLNKENHKLKGFLEIKGKGINKEKLKYIYYRLMGKNTFLGSELKEDIIVKNGNRKFFCRKNSSDLHIISNFYENKVMELFGTLAKESKIIVDVGANVGKYTILASFVNPKSEIYSIEPDKSNFDVLLKNIELNNLKNIIGLNIGMGEEEGRGKLYNSRGESKVNCGGSSFMDKCGNFEIVDIGTLDNTFTEIDLIKIDTEGYELEILKGAKMLLTKGNIKKIILEVNDERIITLLNNYGYYGKNIQYNNYLFEKIFGKGAEDD